MKRKILVFLLALCLAAALVPVTAFAGAMFGGGTGTKDDPWLITSREDLRSGKLPELRRHGNKL